MGLESNGVVSAAGEQGGGAAGALKFLIYGRTGWIGGLLGRLCGERGIAFAYGAGRLESRAQLEADLDACRPTHVFNAAGVTGRPNVDWCERHRVETVRANVAGTLTLADVCRDRRLLLVNFATGCIFEYDDLHPLGSGLGFTEDDAPNFLGSFYSKTKAMVKSFSKTTRMSVLFASGCNFIDLSNPRNFITKITRYEKVVNIQNSMTILDELLPSRSKWRSETHGIWNFTNPAWSATMRS
ncbi:Bifunctional dTDP-4-dehydrorhamnose 3,5-epimerase/dTDP-4-dehydrorhamnose reductase [Ananas comosus]|uniref:Bifunctional dTDP-4-dehydrorhamnose 3,5-epimerase/dTDP-4-dehydrorhamnose reductase n=1 Tax=Ananas comosus TaxID=4615 RepID=A0A199VE69_ANACO|nr:Bifunctional dTDP-4-dehydrorhamnose 3,5-epimerase/dTDP-4-dehydrorhamnose reductase [Ananas comosus]